MADSKSSTRKPLPPPKNKPRKPLPPPKNKPKKTTMLTTSLNVEMIPLPRKGHTYLHTSENPLNIPAIANPMNQPSNPSLPSHAISIGTNAESDPTIPTPQFPSITNLLLSIASVTTLSIITTILWSTITQQKFSHSTTTFTNTTLANTTSTSFFPGRWLPSSDQSCCTWEWNERIDKVPINRNNYDMTKTLLTNIPSGIGILVVGLFVFGFFTEWLQRWSISKTEGYVKKFVILLTLFPILWFAFDDPPQCMYALDSTTNYTATEQALFCNAIPIVPNNTNTTSFSIAPNVQNLEELEDLENLLLSNVKPFYPQLIDKRENGYCVNQIMSDGYNNKITTNDHNKTCEIVSVMDLKTCNFHNGDSKSWYSTPSRLNLTAKELSSTMDVAPLTMAAIFVNFDAGHRYEEGGDYYACYLKMLNIMCVGFSPSCQYRDQKCTPQNKHCRKMCSNMISCYTDIPNFEIRVRENNAGDEKGDIKRFAEDILGGTGAGYNLFESFYAVASSRLEAGGENLSPVTKNMVAEYVVAMLLSINAVGHPGQRDSQEGVAYCEGFVYKYSSYVPSDPEDVSCSNPLYVDPLDRSHWSRVSSFKHGSITPNGNPNPLTKKETELFPYSCVPRKKELSNTTDVQTKTLTCPTVCHEGLEWIYRMRYLMICITWITWLFYLIYVSTISYAHYTSFEKSSKNEEDVLLGDSMASIPLALWKRLLFPFVLNVSILILLLIKMKVLFEANSRIWEKEQVNKQIVLFVLLFFVGFSVSMLYTVAAMVCGGINNIRKVLHISKHPKTKKTASTKRICKQGPLALYGKYFGFRRGSFFFTKMFVSEIFEWCLQFATFQTLARSQHIYYLYASLTILLINVMISPWLLLYRSKTPYMREVIFMTDTILDFCYALLAFNFLTQEKDLRQQVLLFGFIPLASIYTGLMWPIFSLISRTRSLFLAFLRNFADYDLYDTTQKRFSSFGNINTTSHIDILNKHQHSQFNMRKMKRRLSFTGLSPLYGSKGESKAANTSKNSMHSRYTSSSKKDRFLQRVSITFNVKANAMKGFAVPIKACEFFLSLTISTVTFVLVVWAIGIALLKDMECANNLTQELKMEIRNETRMEDLNLASVLWWNARPRIIAASETEAYLSTDSTQPQYNPFLPYIGCQYHLIESVVATNGALGKLNTLPRSMSEWNNLNTLDVRNNQIETMPHQLLTSKMAQLSTVLMKDNPIYTYLDLSHQINMTKFPARLCNLSTLETTALTVGASIWQWDLIHLEKMSLYNTSVLELPINLVECLPCLRTLHVGQTPMVQPVTLNLYEIWSTLISKREDMVCEEQEEGADETSCAHEQWYNQKDSSHKLRKKPTCDNKKCIGTEFVLDVGDQFSKTSMDGSLESTRETNVTVDFSNLLLPMTLRCNKNKQLTCIQNDISTLKALPWYLLDPNCGHVMNNNISITSLNLKCSGIPTLDLDVLSNLVEVEHVDVSENTFATDVDLIDVKVPWSIDPTETASVSKIWYLLKGLTKLKTFKMEHTSLTGTHFTLFSSIWLNNLLMDKKMNPAFAFSVVGSKVSALDWRELKFTKNGCSHDACTQQVKPRGTTEGEWPRPPLWLLHQLSSTLHTVYLRGQQYESDGYQVLQSLCNGVVSSLRLDMSFQQTTTIPDCFWQQRSLELFTMVRAIDVTYHDKYLVNGTVPASLTHLNKLIRFECCDMEFDLTSPIHPLHGSVPELPTSVQEMRFTKNLINGTIPLSWCKMSSLFDMRLGSLPYLRGTLPKCLGEIETIRSLYFNNLPKLKGVIPWSSWKPMLNGIEQIKILGLDLEFSNLNLIGNALPVIFETDCRLSMIKFNNNKYLTGGMSPTISNCPLTKVHIEKTNLIGDLPRELCDTCTLLKLKIDDQHSFSDASVQWFLDNCNTFEQHKARCDGLGKSVLGQAGTWKIAKSNRNR